MHFFYKFTIMKTFSTTLLFLVVTLAALCQDKKDLSISLSTGLFNSPYYEKADAGVFYGLGFDYHITKRHVIAAGYQAGKHEYFDDILSNTNSGINSKGTNAEARYYTFSLTYKYKLLDHHKFSIIPGAGAGIMTLTRDYQYAENNSTYLRTSSWSDLVFPITLDINFQLSKNWLIGLTSGFLIHPDYPILGLHVGPRLSYVLK